MEVRFGTNTESFTDAQKTKIEKKIVSKIEEIHDKLAEKREKGIPKIFKRDNFIFFFDEGQVVFTLGTNAKTWTNLLEKAIPKIKAFTVDSVKIEKPEFVSTTGDEWTADTNIKLSHGQRWKTLSHNGIYLGEPYVPHKIPLVIGKEKLKLSPNEEEYFTFYATRLAQDTANPDATQYTRDLHYIKTYTNDLKTMISKNTFSKIKPFIPTSEKEISAFNKIFIKMAEFLIKKRDKTKEEKAAIKKNNLDIKRKYGYAIIDGRKEEIGNFKVEPPGLFSGRGQNPKRGCIKARIGSKDVTINIGKGEKVPTPSDGGKWGKVVHDNKVTWLATWKDRCTGDSKYVFLGNTSKIKGESDMAKYEKARMLNTMIDRVVKDYTNKMKSKNDVDRQLGTILYLIDNHAFRVGNEKGADEADTVGVSTLKVGNLDPQGDDKVIFDFLGKDSIRFFSTIQLDPVAYKNIVHFRKGKKNSEEVFDKVGSKEINDYLKSFMPALTAKVFRTLRASSKYATELAKIKKSLPTDEKIKKEKDANRAVAVLCNHKRKVSAKAELAVEKKKKELKELKSKIRTLEGKAKERANERAKKMADMIEEKTNNLDKACTTSKTGYIDPRIAVSWASRNNVPLNKIYSATLLKKFKWAIDTTDKKWDYFTSPVTLDIESVKKSKATRTARSKKTGTKKSDATVSQKEVLEYLDGFDHPVTTTEIAKYFGTTKKNINSVLYKMQDKQIHKFTDESGKNPRWISIGKSPIRTSFKGPTRATAETVESKTKSKEKKEKKETKLDENQQRIYDFLLRRKIPVLTRDIVQAMDMDKKTVNSLLYKMKNLLEKTADLDGKNPKWQVKGTSVKESKSKKEKEAKKEKSKPKSKGKKEKTVKSKKASKKLPKVSKKDVEKLLTKKDKIEFELLGCKGIPASKLKDMAKKLEIPGYTTFSKQELCTIMGI